VHFLRFVSARGGATALGTREVKLARELPFFEAPAARRVDMAALLADPGVPGELIEVEAVVERIKIVHIRRKALSLLVLRSLDGKTKIEAALPYIKVNSSGLSASAPAAIRGEWKPVNKELEGRPGIEIDRVNLGELEKRSWYHHLVAAVRPAFELHHMGINIDTALTPGVRGSAKELSFTVART
jgi:hypothetical protein